MTAKRRLSASVDAEALAAAEAAVERGQIESVSAWVNEALQAKAARDRRLLALADFIEDHEREQGVITEQEMEAAVRRARATAVAVRGVRR
jgi:hypothetical protein